ncbi:MAG: AbrB/MazE/SpoVT family DNA-binding domain-containing protein [Clostridia bacterium]|nr:AbrB/MazE/SpoVT family DNA-binding domain-containing protein [Clostridia bacterium]
MKIKICRQIDKLGRLVIPADLRKQYGLKLGDKVWFTAYDNGILIHSENYIYNSENNKEK